MSTTSTAIQNQPKAKAAESLATTTRRTHHSDRDLDRKQRQAQEKDPTLRYGTTGGCTGPPITCVVVCTTTRPLATSPCRKSRNAVNLAGVIA
jgi:hypothetical protein